MDTNRAPRLTLALAEEIISKDSRYIGFHEQSIKSHVKQRQSKRAIRKLNIEIERLQEWLALPPDKR